MFMMPQVRHLTNQFNMEHFYFYLFFTTLFKLLARLDCIYPVILSSYLAFALSTHFANNVF